MNMTREEAERREFIEFVCNSFVRKQELFLKKNEQYAIGGPLANFVTAAKMNPMYETLDLPAAMFEAAKDFCRKHVAHVENGNIATPMIAESLGDIAVYAVIMEYMVHKAGYGRPKSGECCMKE